MIEDIGKGVREILEKTASGSIIGDESEPTEGGAQPGDFWVGMVVVIGAVAYWLVKRR